MITTLQARDEQKVEFTQLAIYRITIYSIDGVAVFFISNQTRFFPSPLVKNVWLESDFAEHENKIWIHSCFRGLQKKTWWIFAKKINQTKVDAFWLLWDWTLILNEFFLNKLNFIALQIFEFHVGETKLIRYSSCSTFRSINDMRLIYAQFIISAMFQHNTNSHLINTTNNNLCLLVV